MDPTVIATLSLLLRPVDGREGVGKAGDCVGVRVGALEFVVVGGKGGQVVRVEAAEERGVKVVEAEDVEVFDVLVADVVGLVMVSDAAECCSSSPERRFGPQVVGVSRPFPCIPSMHTAVFYASHVGLLVLC